MFVSIYNLFTAPARDQERVDFSQFVQDVEKNPERIRKVTIKGSHYSIRYADSERPVRSTGQELDSSLCGCEIDPGLANRPA